MPAAAETTAFLGATLIDGTDAKAVPDSAIVVKDGRIAAVGARASVKIPKGARRVDVRGKWIIPGLIDAHVHLFHSGGLYSRPDIIDLRRVRPYGQVVADFRARIESVLARYIASGITGVVHMGGPMWVFDLRDRARKMRFAPRIAMAGPLLATTAPRQLASADPPMVRISTQDEARREVRRQLTRKPDLIKIWFLGGELDEEIRWIRAAIDEAHKAGVRVAVHATQHDFATAVIAAGADLLVHSIDDRLIEDELLARMKARGAVYIPTMMVIPRYNEIFRMSVAFNDIERRLGDPVVLAGIDGMRRLPRGVLPDWVRPGTPEPLGPVVPRNLARVPELGVIVAAGSDAGNIGTLHGPALHREFEYMADAAGLTPMEVLVAATSGGAHAMGRQRDLGTLEPGKLADMVILDADPLESVRNLRRIHRVVKGGRVIDPKTIKVINER